MVALMLLGSLVAQQSGPGKNRALVSRLREGYVEGGIIDMGSPFLLISRLLRRRK
jgi:hypothetical protein